jgi:hypothetical protein
MKCLVFSFQSEPNIIIFTHPARLTVFFFIAQTNEGLFYWTKLIVIFCRYSGIHDISCWI